MIDTPGIPGVSFFSYFLKSGQLLIGQSKLWYGDINNKPVEVVIMGQDINITNIATLSGLTAEQILDKMVEKKIGIAGSGNSGIVKVVPANLSLGEEFELGGTSWITVHITDTRVFAASKYILDTMVYDQPKFNSTGTQIQAASVYYNSSDIKQHARDMTAIFSDAERAIMAAHPDTGDLVSVMSYNELNGGFSYFNSNARRIAYDESSNNAQYYWTRTMYTTSYLYYILPNGSIGSNLNAHGVNNADGFRPCIVLVK